MSRVLLLGLAFLAVDAAAEGLGPNELGVIYDRNDDSSVRIARYYALQRQIPDRNVIGLAVPNRDSIGREELKTLRAAMLQSLPSNVQSLLLVWSRPYAVECMSVTSAFAAGYQPGFCEPGCGKTLSSPLYDTLGWLPRTRSGGCPQCCCPVMTKCSPKR